jgi:hypothetical protein
MILFLTKKSNLTFFLKENDLIITSFNSLSTQRQTEITNDLVRYFIQKYEHRLTLSVISLLNEPGRADIIYEIIDEIDSADLLRSTIKERTEQMSFFLNFIKKESKNLYALIFYNCCVKHFAQKRYRDKSFYFGHGGFSDKSPQNLFNHEIKTTLLRVIGYGHDELNTIQCEVFNSVFSKRILSRVAPELRSITANYLPISKPSTIDIRGHQLEMFSYLTKIVDFIVSKEEEEYSILFMNPTNECFTELQKNIQQLGPEYGEAVSAIHECAIFLRLANQEQFATVLEKLDYVERWREYAEYLFEKNGIQQFYGKKWFQKLTGLQELPFPSNQEKINSD